MFRILAIILFLPFLSFSQIESILNQDYSFLVTDGEVNKFRQSNDTLYQISCSPNQFCEQGTEGKYFRILSSINIDDVIALKLERLDSIPLAIEPFPKNRYCIIALRNINTKTLEYLPLLLGMTKNELDSLDANIPGLKDKFFFTYYSDSYLKELAGFKTVTTKSEAMYLIDAMKSPRYKTLFKAYRNTKTWEMYDSGFNSDLFTRVCIDEGYNPFGAGTATNYLIK